MSVPDAEPVLCGPWTADEVARLCDVRRRVRAGAFNEFTPEVKRLRWVRWAWEAGLYGR